MLHWYAAKTKSGQDSVALANLKKQLFEVYYPRVIIGKDKTEALFPGYVLIRFHLETESWRSINYTRGIARLLSFSPDGKPSPLPDLEIGVIQGREARGELRISHPDTPRQGDKVRMKVGPYVDQIGEVIRTRGERVEFLIQLLGHNARCIAPTHTLQMVDRQGGPVR